MKLSDIGAKPVQPGRESKLLKPVTVRKDIAIVKLDTVMSWPEVMFKISAFWKSHRDIILTGNLPTGHPPNESEWQ